MRDKRTQGEVILERLQKAGDAGVTNIQLNRICLRYGARIYELRAAGHNIETCDDGKGIFRFILHQPMKFEQQPLFASDAMNERLKEVYRSYRDPEENAHS